MKLSKEYIQGYVDCAIKLSDFNAELNVRAHVYYIDLSSDFNVELNWNTAYDNATDEEVVESANFPILDFSEFKNFHNLFIKQLDEIRKINYDSDYDSLQAEIEFREEMKYEYSKGN